MYKLAYDRKAQLLSKLATINNLIKMASQMTPAEFVIKLAGMSPAQLAKYEAAVAKYLKEGGAVTKLKPDPAIARAAESLNMARPKGSGNLGPGTHTRGKNVATVERDVSGLRRSAGLGG